MHDSYEVPLRYDVTLEDFEVWAIDRLRAFPGDIESSTVRNRSYNNLRAVTALQCKKHLLLNSNGATSVDCDAKRRKDHASQFVLRVVFCRS